MILWCWNSWHQRDNYEQDEDIRQILVQVNTHQCLKEESKQCTNQMNVRHRDYWTSYWIKALKRYSTITHDSISRISRMTHTGERSFSVCAVGIHVTIVSSCCTFFYVCSK